MEDKFRFLVVDDEAYARKGMEKLLAGMFGESAVIYTADGGRECLRLCEEHQPNIIFLDVEMPGATGLDLVREINELSPAAEIIVVTAYPEYSLPALKLHVSDYLLKPVDEADLQSALGNLRVPLAMMNRAKLKVTCFGNFEVYWKGEILSFTRSRAKELLAYLVMKRGAGATSGELCGILWEDEENIKNQKTYLRQFYSSLKNGLESRGCGDVLCHRRECYYINPEAVDCDYYHYLEGNRDSGLFCGEFMSQYSWAEPVLAHLMRKEFSM